MSDTWLVPGSPIVQENNDGADWLIPGASVINEASGAPPPPAKIPVFMHHYNQLRGA